MQCVADIDFFLFFQHKKDKAAEKKRKKEREKRKRAQGRRRRIGSRTESEIRDLNRICFWPGVGQEPYQGSWPGPIGNISNC